jgi:hypothetical protein
MGERSQDISYTPDAQAIAAPICSFPATGPAMSSLASMAAGTTYLGDRCRCERVVEFRTPQAATIKGNL